MSERNTYRVFISTVSNELAGYRAEVARVLRRKGLEVREQEHFRQGPASLIEQLRDYIQQCEAVILLVGECCGAFPTNEHAAALGNIPVCEEYCAATAQGQVSYTQWEFFLAKHFGKKTYVFFTEAGFALENAIAEDADLRACQQAYRRWIQARGEHRDVVTTPNKLIEDVLVLPLPDLGRPQPRSLPYQSIGGLFRGRGDFLAKLWESFRQRGDWQATPLVCKALHGLGGVGKTRLAVEYAWRHANDYAALLLVVADTPENLQRNLAGLAGPLVLDLPEHDEPKEEVRLAATLRWLQRHPGWFLILDNVDTRDAAAAAEKLFARLHGGHVLLTSRLTNWSGHVEPLQVDVLTVDDAVGFLSERTAKRRRPAPDDNTQAHALAEQLGQLALALEQAGAYIARGRLTFAEYLSDWQSNRNKMLAWFDERMMQYPKSVAVTWQTSFDRLSHPARRLLYRLAWLASDPETLLDVQVPAEAAEESHESLTELANYSLVTRAFDTPAFSIHRLVQDVTRRSLPIDAGHSFLTQALRWVDAAFVGDPWDVRTWPTLDPLAPHARAVVQYADDAGIVSPTAHLMHQLGLLLHAEALQTEAEPLMRRALAITEQCYGPDHPDVAIGLHDLANLLRVTNRHAEAEPLFRRALDIDEKSYGPEHSKIAIRLNTLAALLRAMNRHADSEPLMRRALAIDEKSFGSENPRIAVSLNTLAALLRVTNRHAEAEPLVRRALAIDEKGFGPDHPRVAVSLNNLAALLRVTNRHAEAEPFMRRALAIEEKSFGPDHPRVALSLNTLAALLRETSRLAEAEPLMRRALAITERCYGQGHPDVAIRLNNLVPLLQATNRYAEAEPLMRRALAIEEKSFGPDNPRVTISLNNLAVLLRDMNQLAEAEPLVRRALAIDEKGFGPDHPRVAVSLNNLAGLLRDTRRHVEAEPLMRRALAIDEKSPRAE